MAAQPKYPEELRERAVKMVLEIRERDRDGKGHGEIARVGRHRHRTASWPGRSVTFRGADKPGRCLPSSIRLSLTNGKLEEDRTDLGTHRSSESSPIDHITSH